MEYQPFGQDGVVTTLEAFDEQRLQRNAPFSREIRRMRGAAQQPLHFARPVFLLDFHESLQFAQVMEHCTRRATRLTACETHQLGSAGSSAEALGRPSPPSPALALTPSGFTSWNLAYPMNNLPSAGTVMM